MRELSVTIEIKGNASGMFPIGVITELLYQAIEYLEERDRDGADLGPMLPFRRSFREGTKGEIQLVVRLA